MELATPRLQLREFKESDLDDVYAYESDAEVVKYVAYGPYTKAECQRDLAFHIAQQVAEPRTYSHLALLLQGTERVIGWCGVEVSQPHRQEAELGYALHRAYWGRGYITEAAKAIVDYSFTQLRLHRIFAMCRPENMGSVRVMQKLGMQQDEYLHQHKWFKGRWWDSLVYVLVAEDWRARSDSKSCNKVAKTKELQATEGARATPQ